jgi:hypothetical protein
VDRFADDALLAGRGVEPIEDAMQEVARTEAAVSEASTVAAGVTEMVAMATAASDCGKPNQTSRTYEKTEHAEVPFSSTGFPSRRPRPQRQARM